MARIALLAFLALVGYRRAARPLPPGPEQRRFRMSADGPLTLRNSPLKRTSRIAASGQKLPWTAVNYEVRRTLAERGVLHYRRFETYFSLRGFKMRRREFITLLGGAAAALPRAARAQQPLPVMGFLTSRAQGADTHLLTAFREGLKGVGYDEGRNLAIEYRFAENQYDRLPALAADIVRRQVTMIFANGISVAPAKAATTTIPIVFTTGGDPVKLGFVASLARPGGNATGVITSNIGNAVPRLALLRELVPSARIIGFLYNPDSPLTNLGDVQAAADSAGIELLAVGARSDRELETMIANLVELRAGALLVGADPFFVSRRRQLVALAARASLAAVYFGREFVEAGGLISYAASLSGAYRDAGTYAGRVLKGEKPADLPVIQPTKFEMVLNLKTARALALNIPTETLLRAEVIE
jgi:putative ABC transport system substrate-binding protein